MIIPEPIEFIYPTWPAPQNVKSISTTRLGGESVGPYKGNNLALHVADITKSVNRNRARLNVFC